MLSFVKIVTEDQINELAELAKEIWFEYWPSRIGLDQTTYMVENFQTARAMKTDIDEHSYEYYFLVDEQGKTVGYSGGCPERFEGDADNPASKVHGSAINEHFLNRFFISKIYLLAEERGKHYASEVLNFWEAYCRTEDLQGMYLTVNKYNELGIRAYLGRGFETIESFVADIGSGFVMDDYIMAKSVNS